ncbi:MAG: tetratricopeptide repeat protein [bacterium]|nr:tetratricopeptide repeat protein [bacterium]
MKQHENIKYQSASWRTNIKNTIQKSNIFNFLSVILIFAFLFLNFVYSQYISPIYSKFVNNDKKATVTFLQKIKTVSEYEKILKMNDTIYEKTLKQDIFDQENKQNEKISNLEQQLMINPKSRDILYGIYQLYLAKGDKDKAEEYLMRAKEIDPDIN